MLLRILTRHSFVVGLFLRLFLAWFLPFLLDSERFIPGVAYTDIDYTVYNDAAQYIRQGGSPYDRLTYRYTPFLAAVLAVFPYGRFLFCVADAVCGWLICLLRQRQREPQAKKEDSWLSEELVDAIWWLYNPLAINICTRGSAESIMVLLPVLLTVGICTSPQRGLLSATYAGVCHGIAVHSKLYPIIYSLSLMTSFVRYDSEQQKQPFILRWIRRLLQPNPVVFAVSFLLSFIGLTVLAVHWYGPKAWEEGLIYHLSRVDHRHNYSMHWYWIYLARARSENLAWIGRLLLLPQLILLVVTSLGIAPNQLSLALFVQTFLFVTLNKVITAQYFTWYLCLLPLCSHLFAATRRVKRAIAFLLGSMVLWLLCAYCLEMQGMAFHRQVWAASVVFFVANVNLLGALLISASGKLKAHKE